VLAVAATLALAGWVLDTQTKVESDVQKLVPQDLRALEDLNALAELARSAPSATREALARADRRQAEEALAQLTARRHALEELERDRVGLAPAAARLLKERAQFLPHKGSRRVFLIDHVDRANEQAANSLLKTLEEPPDHLVLIMTAENAYDLLPTIRSRAVPFHFAPLGDEEMRAFVRARALPEAARRVQLAGGSPGLAVSIDLAAYDRRRAAMLTLLRVAAGAAPFAEWIAAGEAIGRSRSEKLELHLKVLYDLLRDLLVLREGAGAIRNQDIRGELEALAAKVEFSWLRKAVQQADEVADLIRRNIQKTIALDALIVALRPA
jgi:DNA polymerase-3 subunit delta'